MDTTIPSLIFAAVEIARDKRGDFSSLGAEAFWKYDAAQRLFSAGAGEGLRLARAFHGVRPAAFMRDDNQDHQGVIGDLAKRVVASNGYYAVSQNRSASKIVWGDWTRLFHHSLSAFCFALPKSPCRPNKQGCFHWRDQPCREPYSIQLQLTLGSLILTSIPQIVHHFALSLTQGFRR
jgi:hypothetical protein